MEHTGMAYERHASLGGSGNEPVFGPLTLRNIGGGFSGAALMIGFCLLLGLKPFGADLLLIVPIVGAGMVIGVVLTFNFSGISWLDRLMLAIGYVLRKPTGGTVYTPPAAATAPRDTQRGVTLTRDGVVIARPYRPEEALDG
jgi:hypothetical protein